ncbi:MAG: zinc ABC transporter substrate-binding protein [Paracoccaceae bacterium]|jgi:zinc/manganese transport system substrate-binding protein
MTSLRSVFASATAIVTFSLTVPTVSWAEQPIPVVATFSILGDMVERIGGEHIALTTLVGPDGDTHVYQPTPKAARSVAEADVLFMNGLEFEGWLERLAEAASFNGAMVVATNGIVPIAFEEHEDEHEEHDEDEEQEEHEEHDDHEEHDEHEEHDDHEEHDEHEEHDDHAGHDHGTFDPHAWQSLDNAVIYANNIAAGLAQADPANASAYYINRAVFVDQIVALKSDVDAMMGALPADKRTVVTPHDAFGYFAAAYDLTFEAPQGMSTESEVSAADVAALITQIRRDSISAVFIESITDNRMMEQIANETGATIGGTLYSDALSGETGPASTYLDMIRHNATTLSDALGS